MSVLKASISGEAAAAVPPAKPDPRLVQSAHEFEAAMMKELLAPMVSGMDSTGEEESTGSSNALTTFAGEALGKALSERGGFGIATGIIHQLSGAGVTSGLRTSNHEENLRSISEPRLLPGFRHPND
jgi:Rod binding domain-containing protein